MPIFGFGKKKEDNAPTPAPATSDAGPAEGDPTPVAAADKPKRSLRKRDAFLKHARATADSHQFDYSLEMYISALRHEPWSIELHEELYDVAKRRLANQGKPLKVKATSSAPSDKALAAIHIAATQPLSAVPMLDIFKYVAAAYEAEPDEDYPAIGQFWGKLFLDYPGTIPEKKKKSVYVAAMDSLEACEAYTHASVCCKRAIAVAGADEKLLARLKDLEAAEYSQTSTGTTEGSFRDNIKDAEGQKLLEAQDAGAKTEETKDMLIQAAREAYQEDTADPARLDRLITALLNKQEPEPENEAVELLEAAYAQQGTYKLKTKADDIRIRQFKRQASALTKQIKAEPDNAALHSALGQLKETQNSFELGVFEERAQKYPTDMSVRYDLGRRLFIAKRFDEAIGAFQQATADPKVRARAHQYLGQCFIYEDFLDEAIDTLAKGIESHPVPDDQLGLDLRYLLLDANERVARKRNSMDHAQAARELASTIFQANIGYRDIKDRMKALKDLIDDMSG